MFKAFHGGDTVGEVTDTVDDPSSKVSLPESESSCSWTHSPSLSLLVVVYDETNLKRQEAQR